MTLSGNLGLDQRVQQGADRRHSFQTKARLGGSGPNPDGDRLGRQGLEEIFIGAIITDGEHRGGSQALGRKRGDDPPLVNAIGRISMTLCPAMISTGWLLSSWVRCNRS